MKPSSKIALVLTAAVAMPAAAQAQTAGTLLGAPFSAAGSTISGVAAGHARIAPVVNSTSQTAQPATDGVTNAIAAVGTGLGATGQVAQTDGLRVGSNPDGSSLVTVGSPNANQGTVAAIARANR